MTLMITSETSHYCLREPAHRYWQGGRCVYYFALDLQNLDGLLPQRVDEDMIREANRRLTVSHAANIHKYLYEREDWLLGAMLLGIAPEAVEFQPYKDGNGQASSNFGELRVLANRRNTMRIFDGQHRRRAIGDLLREAAENESSDGRTADILQSSVPVVLYVEQDLKALRQMFSDAAKTKPIEANTVTRFDQRDAFNLAAMHIEQESILFRGLVEMDKATVGRNSQRLLAINQLADSLKTMDVGYGGRVSSERNGDYMLNLDALYKHCLTWADGFLPASREEYEGLVSETISSHEIPEWRAVSLAFNATFIRILAGCYQVWLKTSEDWGPLARFIRKSSLQPGSGWGALLVDAGIVPPGETSPVARRQEVQGAINYIVAEARKPLANLGTPKSQ